MTEADVEKRFAELRDSWIDRIRIYSGSHQYMRQPEFRELVGMGQAILPLVMREFSARRAHIWAWLLVVGELSPDDLPDIPDEHLGRYHHVRQAYLNWARERGYLEKQ